jgi:hypothetical protein
MMLLNVDENAHCVDDDAHCVDDDAHCVGDDAHYVDDAAHCVGDDAHYVDDDAHCVDDDAHCVDDDAHCVDDIAHSMLTSELSMRDLYGINMAKTGVRTMCGPITMEWNGGNTTPHIVAQTRGSLCSQPRVHWMV